MNAPDRAASSTKPQFDWADPLLLDDQLTEEERMVRETARPLIARPPVQLAEVSARWRRALALPQLSS